MRYCSKSSVFPPGLSSMILLILKFQRSLFTWVKTINKTTYKAQYLLLLHLSERIQNIKLYFILIHWYSHAQQELTWFLYYVKELPMKDKLYSRHFQMKWIHQAHHLSSDLEAFLKAWLCNKGVLMLLHSEMHCILTRFIYITGAVRETWMTCSFSRWD